MRTIIPRMKPEMVVASDFLGGKRPIINLNEGGLYTIKAAPSALQQAIAMTATAVGVALNTIIAEGQVAPVPAPQSPPPAASSTNQPQIVGVTLESSTPTRTDSALDFDFTSDHRLIVTLDQLLGGKFTFAAESNPTGDYQNGADFLSISYQRKIGAWTLSPAFRLVKDTVANGETINHLNEGAIYAGRRINFADLSLLLIADDQGFLSSRFWAQSKYVDIGAGVKFADRGDLSQRAEDFFLGIHHPEGRYGAWAGRSSSRDWSLNANLDAEGLGLFIFGKQYQNNDYWVMLRGAFGMRGRPGGDFSQPMGLGTIKVTSGTAVHPFIGPLDIFMFNGPWTFEIGAYRDSERMYQQFQAGFEAMKIGATKLYLGGGILHNNHGAHGDSSLEFGDIKDLQLLGSAGIIIPVRIVPGAPGYDARINLELRTQGRDASASLRFGFKR